MWMKVFVCLCLLYTGSFADTAHCPRAHEVYVDSTRLCYLFQNSLASFTVARRQCQDLGYDLVSFHSAYENHYITSYAGVQFGFENDVFWMGMSVKNSTEYDWTDGSKTNYLNWDKGEPVSDRYCGAVQIADGRWHTKTCSDHKPFVCAGSPQGYATTKAPCVAVPVRAAKCDCSSEIENYPELEKMFGI